MFIKNSVQPVLENKLVILIVYVIAKLSKSGVNTERPMVRMVPKLMLWPKRLYRKDDLKL